MKIPWRLKKNIVKLLGEDRVYNRANFSPSFDLLDSNAFNISRKLTVLDTDTLLEYFLTRKKSEFFVSTEKILSLRDIMENQYPAWRDNILCAAEQMTRSGYKIYNKSVGPLDHSFNWHSLEKGPFNDQLYLSRPQRFGFAPVLAQAALFQQEYLQRLNLILENWQEYATQSIYRWPYNSCHAVIYRLVALNWCWLFISALHMEKPNSWSKSVLYKILSILSNDVQYLAPRIGNSHPNNHLLADYFGGWLIYREFPELIPSGFDFSGYEEKWQSELLRQFYPDGGSFEHATHYQEHGCEMAAMYRLLVSDEMLSEPVNQRIENMLYNQIILAGPAARPIELGDTTEDTLLPLDQTTGWSIKTLQQIYHHCYYNQKQIGYTKTADHKAFWMLAGQSRLLESNKETSFNTFQNSGYFHWYDDSSKEELVYRTGVPPCSKFMPGHMFADCLSVYWRINSKDILVASGTYSYKFTSLKGNNYRKYFCGPQSRNCIIVNDSDPLGSLNGDFRDSDNNLRVKNNYYYGLDWGEACFGRIQSENEYNELQRIFLRFSAGFSLIIDLPGSRQKGLKVSSNWQFSEYSELELLPDRLLIYLPGDEGAQILFSDDFNCEINIGAMDPPVGWISRKYGIKEAAPSLKVTHNEGLGNAYLMIPTIKPDKITFDLAIQKDDLIELKIAYQSKEYQIWVGRRSTVKVTIPGISVEANLVILEIDDQQKLYALQTDADRFNEGINIKNNQNGSQQYWLRDDKTGKWQEIN